VDQRVAGQEREQQQALEHAGQRFRQPEAGLRELTTDVGCSRPTNATMIAAKP
jgi:hypothetical protein